MVGNNLIIKEDRCRSLHLGPFSVNLIVGGGRVSGLVVVSLGVTVVLDISGVTGVAIDVVVDGLFAAIGENNLVVSGGLVTITGLVLAHVNVLAIFLDDPVVFVVGGGLWDCIEFTLVCCSSDLITQCALLHSH